MAQCRDCEQRIIWAENEQGKKVSIDPSPNENGTLETLPTHPDAPLRVVRATARTKNRFIEHYKTCPQSDYKPNDSPSWVREPEGY